MTSNVFPELVAGRQDGLPLGRWLVEGGTTRRGQASCNLRDRVLEVPLEDSPTARVVRAHELMHARVSPYFAQIPGPLHELDARALTVADEFRVNYLLGRIGFDTTLLRDGTEKLGTKMLAEMGEWDEAIRFLLAVIGTGAEKDYFAGIRAARKEWLTALKALRKQVLALIDPIRTSLISDTSLSDSGVPVGYEAAVVPVARLVTRAMQSRAPRDRDESRVFERSIQPGARRAPSGRFADLKWLCDIPSVKVRERQSVRRSKPSQVGVAMRYPNRWVTDDHRRVFAQKYAGGGGIVVIDQSGSMDIDPVELRRLIFSAPGALVIGYSHKPGDLGSTPNAWILAQNGRVAIEPPAGNIGNGVDGPVLRYALKVRRASEPLIWVCDGQVTDSNDHPDSALSGEVAALVRTHGIRMVRNLREVRPALSRGRPRQENLSNFGRVGALLR